MRRIVETDGNAWDALLGEEIVVWCLNYIYSGKLVAANDTHIQLANAVVVYETGELTAKSFKNAQPLKAKHWNIMLSAVESFGARG